MDRKKLREEITGLIDSIKEHSDMITPHERIPQLELELVLSKIKKLYEKSIIFNYLNESYSQPEHIISPEIPFEKIDLQENKVAEEIEITAFENPILESALAKEQPLVQDIKTDVKSDLNSKLQEISPASLNEQIAKSGSRSILSNKLQKKPIADLYKAIGINERFLFTKELFKGDSNKFKKTVDHLNSLTSYNDAQNYIQLSLSDLEWDFKHPTVNNFIELVERRFL